MSLYLGNNLVSGVATPTEPTRNLGQIIESLVPLTDAGIHLLDGALINGSGIYSAFVTYIAGLVSSYPDLFDTEANWQQSVTDYGVCGKFVYDSVANTVRLPKITGIIEGTTDVTALGDLVQAGLPNITGAFSIVNHNPNYHSYTGAFKKATIGSTPVTGLNGGPAWTEGWGDVTEYFDASSSNSTYGNSTTVQPQTIKCYYYIVIATTTKTEIEVDIDEIATDLNGKVNIADCQEVQCVVETYVNGTSWYRVWSDGWCEQGGRATGSNSGRFTINFLKTLKDSTMFYPTLQIVDSTQLENHATGSYVYSHTKSSMVCGTVYFRSGTPSYLSLPVVWKVEGYIEV